jgi:SsrA-binding protein
MSKSNEEKPRHTGSVATNRRARFDYHIHEVFEAGLELKGSEVKSLRNRQVSLDQSFGRLLNGELHLVGMTIAPYKEAGIFGHEPLRPRKLLLHKREIEKITGQLFQRGFTLIPLRLYFRRGFAKVEIAIASGQKKYDKREAIKRREAQREISRELGRARRMRENGLGG